MSQLNIKKLKPAPGYILVQPEEVEKKTSSGVYLPDSHDEKPQHGKVLAVGSTWTTEQKRRFSSIQKVGW